MALEDAGVKPEQTYADLTCGAENVSPYSSASSSYSEQSSYYQHDYDWHHHQQQHPHYHQHHEQQPAQPQQPHTLQTSQLTDLPSRQYYSSYPDSHELPSAVGTYPGFSHHTLHQGGDFYSPLIWPTGQADYIPASSMTSSPRLFSGIDVSQHAVVSGQQPGNQSQQSQPTKPKRKRVQSFSQRKAANVRERKRMFHLNEAFDVLRKRLPAFNYEKRLSRIETLRLAMTYISFMKEVSVGEDPKSIKLKPHGLILDDSTCMDGLDGQGSSPVNVDGYDLSTMSNEYSDSSSNDGLCLQGGMH